MCNGLLWDYIAEVSVDTARTLDAGAAIFLHLHAVSKPQVVMPVIEDPSLAKAEANPVCFESEEMGSPEGTAQVTTEEDILEYARKRKLPDEVIDQLMAAASADEQTFGTSEEQLAQAKRKESDRRTVEHWEAELGADGGFEAGMNDSHWERSMNDAHWEQGAGVGLDKTQIFADEGVESARQGPASPPAMSVWSMASSNSPVPIAPSIKTVPSLKLDLALVQVGVVAGVPGHQRQQGPQPTVDMERGAQRPHPGRTRGSYGYEEEEPSRIWCCCIGGLVALLLVLPFLSLLTVGSGLLCDKRWPEICWAWFENICETAALIILVVVMYDFAMAMFSGHRENWEKYICGLVQRPVSVLTNH